MARVSCEDLLLHGLSFPTVKAACEMETCVGVMRGENNFGNSEFFIVLKFFVEQSVGKIEHKHYPVPDWLAGWLYGVWRECRPAGCLAGSDFVRNFYWCFGHRSVLYFACFRPPTHSTLLYCLSVLRL